MSEPESPDISRILAKVSSGDPRAAHELLPLVYEQLRAAAQKQMAQERGDHTLQATALVHEAYVRLVGSDEVSWENRAHFYVAAAEAMRAQSAWGACLASLRRFDEAEPILLGSQEVLEREVGRDSTATRDAGRRIVQLYEAWGKPERAAQWAGGER